MAAAEPTRFPLEGIAVLVTDYKEGVCFSLLEFLITNKTVPYIIVQDLETTQEVYANFPEAVPMILDYHNSVEATANHIKNLPPLTCIFNFNGDSFENLYRQSFENFNKSITTSSERFDETLIYNELLEAVMDGYSLFCNFVSLTLAIPTPTSVEAFLLANPISITTTLAATSSALNSSRNLKFVFEKIFFRQPDAFDGHKGALKRKRVNDRSFASQNRDRSNFRDVLKRFFTKFNPCSTISVLNILPTISKGSQIRTPAEISRHIIAQANHDVKIAFQTIHDSALHNWNRICEENFHFTPPEIEKRFAAFCEDIERQSEEGRKSLMEKFEKDIERTKQWDHVLGAKTIERLRITRAKEIDMKVSLFYKRKIEETRKKINAEIEDRKERAKTQFYGEILEEQLATLHRIKAKSARNKELLMLPHTTGELRTR